MSPVPKDRSNECDASDAIAENYFRVYDVNRNSIGLIIGILYEQGGSVLVPSKSLGEAFRWTKNDIGAR